MNNSYIIAPIFAYLIAGSLKFAINSVKTRSLAFKHIGLGGLPSTHMAIVSATAMLIGLKEGFNTSSFGVIFSVAIIVLIDATDLRRKVGQHAQALKALYPSHEATKQLRVRIGHSIIEIFAGIATGAACGSFLFFYGEALMRWV